MLVRVGVHCNDVPAGDRAGLLAAMPEAHKALLSSLEFVVEIDGVTDRTNPEITRIIAVHAGLEAGLKITMHMHQTTHTHTQSYILTSSLLTCT